jgi:hypothetical protein
VCIGLESVVSADEYFTQRSSHASTALRVLMGC